MEVRLNIPLVTQRQGAQPINSKRNRFEADSGHQPADDCPLRDALPIARLSLAPYLRI